MLRRVFVEWYARGPLLNLVGHQVFKVDPNPSPNPKWVRLLWRCLPPLVPVRYDSDGERTDAGRGGNRGIWNRVPKRSKMQEMPIRLAHEDGCSRRGIAASSCWGFGKYVYSLLVIYCQPKEVVPSDFSCRVLTRPKPWHHSSRLVSFRYVRPP